MTTKHLRTTILAAWVASTIFAGATEHFVSLTGAHVPPFANWADAATNIQDAIDASSDGNIIWVTNGIYATGGKVMYGDLTNRVALDKAVSVQSVNGPAVTIIQGAWDANTNGPAAARCAWLTNGATLSGFTLQGGATRTNGDATLQNGGGVWGVSTQAIVMNCWIATNAAAGSGGGSFQAGLDRCKVIGNQAAQGGGTANGAVQNSFISKNIAATFGGGSYQCYLNHCSVTENRSQYFGSGVYASSVTVRNSIIFDNWPISSEFSGSPMNITYCCLEYVPRFPGDKVGGVGNISSYPEFTDSFHLSITSPCRGTGSALYPSNFDLDGEAWSNPPTIGCDEVIESNINGPLAVSAKLFFGEAIVRQQTSLVGEVTGRATRLEWDFGDGVSLTNQSTTIASYVWANAGDYTVTFTAYNNDFPNGVSTDFVVHVVPLIAPTFLSISKDGSTCILNFFGQPGVFGLVERAVNLTPPISWKTIGYISGTNNLIQVIDWNATNSHQFYRVRIPDLFPASN